MCDVDRTLWALVTAAAAVTQFGCRATPASHLGAAAPAIETSSETCTRGGGQAHFAPKTPQNEPVPGVDQPLVNPVAYSAPAEEPVPTPPPVVGEMLPDDAAQGGALDVESLVAEVLARHPDIRSAAAAWRAAAARYPQEIALDDPMFGFLLGPNSWGDPTVESAYMLEASQKLPWPGKRRLRGNVARAEANAAYFDVGEQRLQIAEAARLAYYDYFLADRRLAVLADSTNLLRDFREIARVKYESAEVEQQDVLLADVELAELDERRVELERASRVAEARINTLLLLPPEAPLPPPPDELPLRERTAAGPELQGLALAQRPELAAQAARIRAERYAVALACREFYPDLEVMARYDAFWQEEPLRPMVGMNVNVPIYREKRWAAVREARARVAREQSELESRINELAFQVESALARVQQSERTLAIYRERLVPTARLSIESARASYVSGTLDFLRLVESQRQFLDIQDRYYMALAEYHQRLAELDRLVGGYAPPPAEP
jgi:outer membrane protein TolC